MSAALLTAPCVSLIGARADGSGRGPSAGIGQRARFGAADISGPRLAESAAPLAQELPAVQLVTLRCDVTPADEAQAFAHLALNALGGIDVLVNTVGGLCSKQLYTPLLDMAKAQWHPTFDLNLMCAFHLTRAFAPGMTARGAARIINFATIVFEGEQGQADYAAAKAAVASPTAELAPAVTVNALAPGLTRTSITQLMPAAEAARLIGGAFNPRMAFLSAI